MPRTDVDLDAVEVVADGGGDVPLARLHVEDDGEAVLPTGCRLHVSRGARVPVGIERFKSEIQSWAKIKGGPYVA